EVEPRMSTVLPAVSALSVPTTRLPLCERKTLPVWAVAFRVLSVVLMRLAVERPMSLLADRLAVVAVSELTLEPAVAVPSRMEPLVAVRLAWLLVPAALMVPRVREPLLATRLTTSPPPAADRTLTTSEVEPRMSTVLAAVSACRVPTTRLPLWERKTLPVWAVAFRVLRVVLMRLAVERPMSFEADRLAVVAVSELTLEPAVAVPSRMEPLVAVRLAWLL